jgi:AraC-like DNA-binding protein
MLNGQGMATSFDVGLALKSARSPGPAIFPVDDATGLREIAHYRRTLHRSTLALIEDCSALPLHSRPSSHSADCQVVIPYLGVFGYKVGAKELLFDANRTLFVTAGEEFAHMHLVADVGYSGIIVTPSQAVIEEACGWCRPARHPAFRDVSRPATPRVRMLAHRLRDLSNGDGNALLADELSVAVIRNTLSMRDLPRRSSHSRIVDRAKQYLHAHFCERVTLGEVARVVGVSSVYLTQEFTRSEGLSLYRYQMLLRLNRSLVELPHCDSITDLALALGFSSHSHFGAAFKAMYGVTPSDYRSRGVGAAGGLRSVR